MQQEQRQPGSSDSPKDKKWHDQVDWVNAVLWIIAIFVILQVEQRDLGKVQNQVVVNHDNAAKDRKELGRQIDSLINIIQHGNSESQGAPQKGAPR